MDSLGVPMGNCVLGLKVVRLREGQTVRGIVGRPAVGVLVHWSGKSELCTDPLGDGSCRFCAAGDVPQWQAFVPVRHVVDKNGESVEVKSLLMLGSRAIAGGGLSGLNDLVGYEVEFRRGKKRRFVEVQRMLAAEAWDCDTCAALAVLFGAARFWAAAGSDPYRNLLEAVKRANATARAVAGKIG